MCAVLCNISLSKAKYSVSTHLEAAQLGVDPCQQVQVRDPASEAGFSSFPPAPSGSYRSSPLAGDSTQPVKKMVTKGGVKYPKENRHGN